MKRFTMTLILLATMAAGAASAQQEHWFTCQAGAVCVEYMIENATDRQNLISQCANSQTGRACSGSSQGCTHRAPGRVSVTYGGDVDAAAFRRYCEGSGGTME